MCNFCYRINRKKVCYQRKRFLKHQNNKKKNKNCKSQKLRKLMKKIKNLRV